MCTCEEIIELPRQILEKALDDRAHAQSYATITMTIIEVGYIEIINFFVYTHFWTAIAINVKCLVDH